MNILLAVADQAGVPEWLTELRAALPQARIDAWQPGLLPEYDVALVWSPPQQLFDEQPQLRLAFNLGAGVDGVMALRLPADMQVARLEDAGMAVQMAEYVCHALIRWFREFDGYAQQQRQAIWQKRPPRPRKDFSVGIMGLGVMGERVAQTVRAFDFPVLGWSRTPRMLDGVRCHAGEAELDAFLQATRVLVCLLPLTDETQGLLNAERLRRLRPDAHLINIARGGLIVEADLQQLLDEGRLAHATLDVMGQEPLPADHWMWTHPRVTLTPHISGMTLRAESVAQAVRAVQALRHGKPLPGLVDRGRGY